MGSCIKPSNADIEDSREKKKPAAVANNSGQAKTVQNSRVNENDQAILKIKANIKKLKVYSDKLQIDAKTQDAKIKELIKDKQKERAVLALRIKKLKLKELEKADGAMFMLQETISNIESAQMDVNVMQAMKDGEKVLSELQKAAKLEDFEKIYDNIQERDALKQQEIEFYGQIINEDELLEDLNKLEADMYAMQVPDAAVGVVAPSKQQEALIEE